ncbi:MAG: DMT family transporter [Thermoanaerobaculia bacterium]|nr:DMT family transporter [Thermoanaerobaculia bacterium]
MRAPRSPILTLLVAALCFAAMALAAKLAARTLPGESVAFVRFLVMLLPLAIPGLARRAVEFQRVDLLVYRGLFGGVAVLLYFLAIEKIPVGLATLLNSTSPVWAVLCAALFLGERARPLVALPFAAALAGIALASGALAAPGGGLRLGTWEAVALVSSILSGVAVTAIRAARRSEGSWAIYGSFTLCGALVTAPFALAVWRWPDAREWALLIVVGLASVAAQLLMTHAYRWVDNLQAGVILQLNVVATMAIGAALLGERLAPSQLAGATLALAGVVGVIVLQRPPRALE